MSFKEELKKTWEEEKRYLESIDPKSEPELYKAQLDRINEVEKRLTDIEKTELEVEEKAAGRDMDERFKKRQAEEEQKSQKTKNKIEVAKILVPTGAGFLMGIIAMVYEKTDIMSSTTGKASWRDIIKFKI